MWLDRVELEHDNLRAAMEWGIGRAPEEGLRLAAAVWWYWMWRGHAIERYQWLDRALAVASDAPCGLRGRALAGAGSIAWLKGDLQVAQSQHEASLAHFREAGDQWGTAFALNNVGVQMVMQGEYDRAKALFEESLLLWRGIGDKWGMAMTLGNLGEHAAIHGDPGPATRLLEESASLARESGDRRQVGGTLLTLGEVEWRQSEYEQARALIEEALARARDVGDRHLIARALHDLGQIATDVGDHDGAAAFLRESMSLWGELVDKAYIAECLEALARAAFARDRCERAARLSGAAEALREAIGSPIEPVERGRCESAVAGIRDSLGEQASRSAWADGRAMNVEQAVGYGLGDPPES